MNYHTHYNQLIAKARSRSITGYYELHHVIPRCLGGDDSPLNLIRLTPEEHYTAHLLLVKMYPRNRRLVYAANMMCVSSNAHVRNNKRYGWLKRQYQLVRKEHSVGIGNTQFNTMWICDVVNKVNKKISRSEPIPAGWVAGRNKWKPPYARKPKPKSTKPPRIKKYKNGYKVSVDGTEYDSISQAADMLGLGHETARMRFKSKSFPGYVILGA